MNKKRILLFLAGVAAGAGVSYLLVSGKGKKATTKVLALGMKLKDDASVLLESAKEDFDDMVAEAKAKKEKQIADKNNDKS